MNAKKAKAQRRMRQAEIRNLAACIETPDDLLRTLAALPNDAQRKEAVQLLRPHLKFSVTTNED